METELPRGLSYHPDICFGYLMHDSFQPHILFLPSNIRPGISHTLPFGLPSALMETFLSVTVSCEERCRSFPTLRLQKKNTPLLGWCIRSLEKSGHACQSSFDWLPVCVCVCVYPENVLSSIRVHSWLLLTSLKSNSTSSLS